LLDVGRFIAERAYRTASEANMDTLRADTIALPAPLRDMPFGVFTKRPPADMPRTPCDGCGGRRLCQATQMGCNATAHTNCHIVTRKLRAGEAVYRTEDPFRNLYVPRAGMCKSIRLHRDGHQQITGFHLAGEFMGLDAIATGRHETEAIALEDMVLCVLPYYEIQTLCDACVDARRCMERMLSSEIVREANLLMLMGHLSAEERLAAFLADLAERYAERGYSSVSFNLRMTREEIGSYLGMKLETVSRMFSRLQRRGLILLHGREVRILNLDLLNLG